MSSIGQLIKLTNSSLFLQDDRQNRVGEDFNTLFLRELLQAQGAGETPAFSSATGIQFAAVGLTAMDQDGDLSVSVEEAEDYILSTQSSVADLVIGSNNNQDSNTISRSINTLFALNLYSQAANLSDSFQAVSAVDAKQAILSVVTQNPFNSEISTLRHSLSSFSSVLGQGRVNLFG
ncbi:MAG: hypothetical protein HQL69_06505 [Magnetococcales bacterium]|nr:hypothetical protein [Magnetococcales bacterium]